MSEIRRNTIVESLELSRQNFGDDADVDDDDDYYEDFGPLSLEFRRLVTFLLVVISAFALAMALA